MKRVVLTLLHNRIQVSIGSPGVRAGVETFYQEELSYTDSVESWEDAVRRLWETHSLPRKHILMVLPHSAFNIRILSLPPTRDGRLALAVQNELQYNVNHELVTDYIPLYREKSGVRRVLACSCPREELLRFIDMSKRLGFELEGITVPAAAALRVLRDTHGMRDQSCIWLCFDGAALLSLVVERGICYYASHTRFWDGPGEAGFATAVTRNVSNTLQFRAAQRINTPLSHVYYAGCSMRDFEGCVSGLQSLGLQAVCLPRCERIVRFPPAQRMSDWLVCAGSMLRRRGKAGLPKHKELDLYLRCRRYSREKSKRSLFRTRWFPVVVTALLCTLTWQALALRNLELERELSAHQIWLDNPQNTAAYEEALTKDAVCNRLKQQAISVQTLTARLAAYPRIDADLLARIAAVGGKTIRARIVSYNSSAGELLLQAESRTTINTSGYVRDLERLGLFQTVSYTGYALQDGLYTLQLKCMLRAVDSQKEGLDAAGTIGK